MYKHTQLKRTQWRTVPACQRHAVYASAIACLADWATTYGDRDDGQTPTKGVTHTIAKDVCQLCFQWAVQGMDSLLPTVQAAIGSADVVHALSMPSSTGTARMQLTAELVGAMCAALTRIQPRDPTLVAGMLIELSPPLVTAIISRPVSCTHIPTGAARALRARSQYELLPEGLLLSNAVIEAAGRSKDRSVPH